MKNSYISKGLLFILLSFVTFTSFAWDRSIEIGFGHSHDPNNTRYNNSAVQLYGDFYPLWRNDWTFWSLNAAVAQWHSSAPQHKNLTTAAVSLALRFYAFNFASIYPFYLLGSVGPAYLSDKKFGTNTQGNNLSIQTDLGLGTEFRNVDVNFRLAHYSNANLAKPNDGFNVLYMLSIGYLF